MDPSVTPPPQDSDQEDDVTKAIADLCAVLIEMEREEQGKTKTPPGDSDD
jgi:hypothetical protein